MRPHDRRPGPPQRDPFWRRTPGGRVIAPAIVNYSMQLNDGVANEYLAVAAGGVLNCEYTAKRTIAMWAKTTDGGANVQLCSNIRTSGTFRGYTTFLNAGSAQWYQANTNATNYLYTGTVTSTFDDGAWHLFVWTWDGNATPDNTDLEPYVDDVNLSDTVFANTLSATTVDAASKFAIGARVDASVTLESKIKWAQCSIWDKVLSGAELTELHNGGALRNIHLHSAFAASCIGAWEPRSTATTVPDLSGNGNDLVAVNCDASNFDGADLPT